VEGRPFERGLREVIVGQKAARQFAGLSVGSRIGFRDSDWTVVGIFTTGGDVHESEIWSDTEVTMSAFRREGYQSVTARLADGSAEGLQAFKDSVSSDPRFSIAVLREPEYYAKQASVLSTLINVLGYTVAGFMAIGATFGALNCMYSAIASRQVEIATLRAIGFGALPVVVSVMIEALVLALLGGAVGGALAYVYCDGFSLSTLNFNTFSQVAFDFRVTRELLVQGFVWALAIGLAGGFLPAVRARPPSGDGGPPDRLEPSTRSRAAAAGCTADPFRAESPPRALPVPGPDLLEDLRVAARFFPRLPGFLRRRVTGAEARRTVRARLANREADFLGLCRDLVYGNSASPYRALLTHAGCEPGDLERLVRSDGVEGASWPSGGRACT
jgi:hypothetical protein